MDPSRVLPTLLIATLVVIGLTRCDKSPIAPTGDASTERSIHSTDHCGSIGDLRARIDALEADGTLNHGRATALRSKLAQADRWEAEGRSDMAATALRRLIAQVEAWVAEGALSEEDAGELLECAEELAGEETLSLSAISAGGSHSCGLTPSDTPYCWGWNFAGQLGDGTMTDSSIPVAVAGDWTFVRISAGWLHSCGLTASGDAYCWGSNIHGSLGDATNTDSSVPVAVSGGLRFVEISAGTAYTCGLTTTGAAYCWGLNTNGQLGNDTDTFSNVPIAVDGSLAFAEVSAGVFHTCGRTATGAAYCWGSNSDGQLGDNSTTFSSTPVAVVGGLAFARISAGSGGTSSGHTCGLTTTGSAYCWGRNARGQLGDGTNADSSVPVPVSGTRTYQDLDAGLEHTCAVTASGDAFCWGWNLSGGLGDGTTMDSSVPVAVDGGITFRAISAGQFHTCGLASPSSGAYCWGNNLFGALGDGTTSDSSVPVAVLAP